MLSSACKNTAIAYYRFTRVVFYYNVLGGKIFCSGFFSAAKKILASKIKITEK